MAATDCTETAFAGAFVVVCAAFAGEATLDFAAETTTGFAAPAWTGTEAGLAVDPEVF